MDSPHALARLARAHPALCMLAITWVWTWGWWFATFAWFQEPAGLRLALFVLGSFGPAIGGILTLRWRDSGPREGPAPVAGFLAGAALAALAFVCFSFDVMGVTSLTSSILVVPDDTPLWAYLAMGAPVLVSGWVFASVQSRNRTLRHWFSGLLPTARTLLLAVPLVLVLPVVLVISNLLAQQFGLHYDPPRYVTDPASVWLPLMVVKLLTVCAVTGGNEEHGWRGVLLPFVQRRFSPLVAALGIGVIWELWHLPLVVNGIYGDGPLLQIVIGRMLMVVALSVIFAALYNRSRGSIFLCVLAHACVNTQPALFAGSELAGAIILVLVIWLVVAQKMWRKGSGFDPEAAAYEKNLRGRQRPAGQGPLS